MKRRQQTVDVSTLRQLRIDITAEEIVDAMWIAFRQARAGGISARAGQVAVSDYWAIAKASGKSSAVAAVIVSRSEATIRGDQ